MKREKMADLSARTGEELQGLLARRQQEAGTAHYSHAKGELRATHTLRRLRKAVARVYTALSQVKATGQGVRS